MKRNKMVLWVVVFLAVLFFFSISTASSATRNSDPLPTQVIQQELSDTITQAILTAVAANTQYQRVNGA
jgi:HAMP domain-containing protein